MTELMWNIKTALGLCIPDGQPLPESYLEHDETTGAPPLVEQKVLDYSRRLTTELEQNAAAARQAKRVKSERGRRKRQSRYFELKEEISKN